MNKKEIGRVLNSIIRGDTLTELKKLPDDCIDMVITSPPYYGLRKYGDYKEQIGLEKTFNEYLKKILEITAELKRVLKPTGQFWLNLGDCYSTHNSGGKEHKHNFKKEDIGQSWNKPKQNLSEKCLMMMPERISMKMIDDQGWILRNKIAWAKQVLLKKENRTMGSVMPTSVKDRFNESWEYLYFFTKSKKYYSDLDAVRLKNQTFENRPDGIVRSREFGYNSKYLNDFSLQSKQSNVRDSPRARTQRKSLEARMEDTKNKDQKSSRTYNLKKLLSEVRLGIKSNTGIERNAHLGMKSAPQPNEPNAFHPLGKNLPSVWLIGSEPHNFQKELNVDIDHFAIFPQALLEIPIKFGCPEKVCRKCGKPVMKIIKTNNPKGITGRAGKPMMTDGNVDLSEGGKRIEKGHSSSVYYSGKVRGYTDCGCNAGFETGTVLDPFMGAGTTAVVAKKLGRNYIGIELNKDYIKIAEKRIAAIPPSLFEIQQSGEVDKIAK